VTFYLSQFDEDFDFLMTFDEKQVNFIKNNPKTTIFD